MDQNKPLKVTIHWMYFARSFFVVLLFFVIAAFGYYFLAVKLQLFNFFNWFGLTPAVVFLTVVGLGTFITVLSYLNWKRKNLYIYPNAIVMRGGKHGLTQTTAAVTPTMYVTVDRKGLGRHLGYGIIEIYEPLYNKTYYFDYIIAPEEAYEVLRQLIISAPTVSGTNT